MRIHPPRLRNRTSGFGVTSTLPALITPTCVEVGMTKPNDITTEEFNQRRRRRAEKMKGYVQKCKEKKKELGLCLICGKQKEDTSILHCNGCKRKRMSIRLKCLYGITADEYDELSALQGHVCWVCGKKETTKDGYLHVDHCHKTGKVRGLLCGLCNRGIGALGDSIELLEKAIEYLKTFND